MPSKSAKPTFWQKYWPWISALGFISLCLVLYLLLPGFQHFLQQTWHILMSKDEEKISTYFQEFGFWGPLLIIVITGVQMFLVFFPNAILIVVAMLAYGPVWGTVISLGGNIAASSVGYVLGNSFRAQTRKMVSAEKIKRMEQFLKRYGFGAVVIFHLSPFISNDVVSIVAGISKMNFWRFLLATMVGAIPFTIAFAWFGRRTETLEAGLYWIGGVGLVLYLLYVWLDHRLASDKIK